MIEKMFDGEAKCRNDSKVGIHDLFLFMNYVTTGDLFNPKELESDKVVSISKHITTGCENCLSIMEVYVHLAASIYNNNHLDPSTLTDEKFQSIKPMTKHLKPSTRSKMIKHLEYDIKESQQGIKRDKDIIRELKSMKP